MTGRVAAAVLVLGPLVLGWVAGCGAGCDDGAAPEELRFAVGPERPHAFVIRNSDSDPKTVELVALVAGDGVVVATRESTGPEREQAQATGSIASTLEPLASREVDDVLWVVYRAGGARPPDTPPRGVGLLYVSATPLFPGGTTSPSYLSRDPLPHTWNWARVRATSTSDEVLLDWAMTAQAPPHRAGAHLADGRITLFEAEVESEGD